MTVRTYYKVYERDLEGNIQAVIFHYSPSQDRTRGIRFTEFSEHWIQFEDLLKEAGYRKSKRRH